MEQKVWLFITRAQPGLHYGHIDGIKQGIAQGVTKVLIGVGSANKEFSTENPFTFEERYDMIKASVQEVLSTLEVEVFPIPDFGDNEKWLNYIEKNLPPFDCVLTGNPWVQQVFLSTGKTIIPLEIKEFIRGTTIREQIARYATDQLPRSLPSSVLTYLASIKAFDRLKELFHNEKKWPSLTVDIVMFTPEGKLILIQRGHYPEGVALPGWFVDIGESCAEAAVREASEETGLQIRTRKLLGEWSNPDRDPRAHNVTLAYLAEIIWGQLKAGDDAKEIVLLDPKDLATIKFAFPDHKEIIEEALLEKK
jgi:8-oxo-dGTP diphosphatase